MIFDFLTNVNWLTPQIDFLVYLQNIRNSLGVGLDNFFLSVTLFGEYLFPFLIVSVIYWCIDTKKGIYLFSICFFSVFLTQLIKMTACIYRPWVLSAKVHPSAKAISHAGGYSFPSGHSALSTTFLGGLMLLMKDKKFMCFVCALLIFLVCFSRMFLGVHTPQDVLVGLFIGIFLIFVLYHFINWLEKDKKRYLPTLVILNILLVVACLYIFKKPYPIDYLNHKILVMPKKAIYNSIISFGIVGGLINGLFLFRRFFEFNPRNISIKKRIWMGLIGVTITYFLINDWVGHCFVTQQTYLQICLKTFFAGFFITFIYPLSCKFFIKSTN